MSQKKAKSPKASQLKRLFLSNALNRPEPRSSNDENPPIKKDARAKQKGKIVAT
jgi:hypothetical protein